MFRIDFGFLLPVAWLMGFSASAQNDRAHQLAAQAANQKPAQCESTTTTSAACHPSHTTGCSDAVHSRYDAYLNFLKNQVIPRDLAPARVLGVPDFHKLEDGIPTGITQFNHASFAKTQLPGLGEGNIFALVGFLYFVENTSGTPGHPGETCNCQLIGPETGDYHLGIGFDPALAQQVQHGTVRHDPHQPGKLEQTSIVAEMTPHTRDPKWTVPRLMAQVGKQVKVVGQLMLDNMHANPHDDCSFSADLHATSHCWRATVWELHPVTVFLVCKDGITCTATSPDTNWTRLEALP